MQTLRSWIIFSAFYNSMFLSQFLYRAIDAIYFGGRWASAVIFGIGAVAQALVFIMGCRDMNRAAEKQGDAQILRFSIRSERWNLSSTVLGLLFAGFTIWLAIERLFQPQVPILLKALLLLVALVNSAAAVLQVGEARVRWRMAQRLVKNS